MLCSYNDTVLLLWAVASFDGVHAPPAGGARGARQVLARRTCQVQERVRVWTQKLRQVTLAGSDHSLVPYFGMSEHVRPNFKFVLPV